MRINIYMNQKDSNPSCVHLDQANKNVSAKTPDGCEECLQMGSEWVHLRLCLSCGMLDAVISLSINTVQNISIQVDIQLLNHMNQGRIGNGVS